VTEIPRALQAQANTFLLHCAFAAGLRQAEAAKPAQAETGAKALPAGTRHHAIKTGLVAPPARKPSQTQRQLDADIATLGLRK